MAREGKTRKSRVYFEEETQLVLKNVIISEDIVGRGSYGKVLKARYEGECCVAKEIDKNIVKACNENVVEIIASYKKGLGLIMKLQHPHVIRYLGLCHPEDFAAPLLVMEKLDINLEEFLEFNYYIPLPVKISILRDICDGLAYLHNLTPALVHGDLTARNVVLNSSLSAKITDIFNFKFVNLKVLNDNPGVSAYMAPEVFMDCSDCGPPLDVFSFGHLSLYVLTQKSPGNLLPQSANHHSEVERRKPYMDKLQDIYRQSYPILLELVRNCLSNDLGTRPTSRYLLSMLQSLKTEVEQKHGGNMVDQMSMRRILNLKEAKEATLHLTEQYDDLKEKIGILERNIQSMDVEKTEKQEKLKTLSLDKKKLESQVEKYTEEIQRLRS